MQTASKRERTAREWWNTLAHAERVRIANCLRLRCGSLMMTWDTGLRDEDRAKVSMEYRKVRR